MNQDVALAEHRLKEAARVLAGAKAEESARLASMRGVITYHLVHRTAPIASLATAAGKARNYVDRIKAKSSAAPLRGADGNRVPKARYDVDTSLKATREVNQAAEDYRLAKDASANALSHRDKVICEVYAARLMGPTEIGRAVDLDRNSVMRITRAARVPRMRPVKGATA